MLNTFVVYVENKPGVLNRVASLFRRRDFNIESLTVGHTETPGISRMTIVTDTDAAGAYRVETNLYKLVNVISVENISAAPSVCRELAMIKVAATSAENRTQLMQLAAVFRARVVDVAPAALVIEITGTEDKIDGLLEVLRHYGILEMVRTGRVAMSRGASDALSRATSDAARAANGMNGDATDGSTTGVQTPSLDTDDGMIAFSV
jgi:acetolactate synthase I/III small subunit